MHSRLIGPTGAATATPMETDFQKSHTSMFCSCRAGRITPPSAHPRRWELWLDDLDPGRYAEQGHIRLLVWVVPEKAHRVFDAGRLYFDLQRQIVWLQEQRQFKVVQLQAKELALDPVHGLRCKFLGAVVLEKLEFRAEFEALQPRRLLPWKDRKVDCVLRTRVDRMLSFAFVAVDDPDIRLMHDDQLVHFGFGVWHVFEAQELFAQQPDLSRLRFGTRIGKIHRDYPILSK